MRFAPCWLLLAVVCLCSFQLVAPQSVESSPYPPPSPPSVELASVESSSYPPPPPPPPPADAYTISMFGYTFKMDQDFWLYCSIPVVSAIVGYSTNVIALQMTFYPVDYIGLQPELHAKWGFSLGWQGIVPNKAKKIAKKAVDLMIGQKLVDVPELFSRVDPKKVAQYMEPALGPVLEKILGEVALEQAPDVWEALPMYVKEELIMKAKEDAPEHIANIMQDVKDQVTDVFDIEHLVVTMLDTEKAILNTIFQECGAEELVFIQNSGFYFGFLFGLVQAAIWVYHHDWYILPIAGFLCGYLTNLLALKLIFEPKEPKRLCCCTVLGLFIKRQQEVSKMYGHIVASRILNGVNILKAIMEGPDKDRFFMIVHRHVRKAVDAQSGPARPFIQMSIGTQEYLKIKSQVCDRVCEESPGMIKFIAPYTEQALRVEETMVERLQSLTPAQFEGILHPAFEEDEWILILVGGLLGMGVGFFQVFVVFAGK